MVSESDEKIMETSKLSKPAAKDSEDLKPVKQFKVLKGMKSSDLVKEMTGTAYNARALGEAADIWLQACKEKDCVKFFGVSGAMVPGGMRQIFIDMIEQDMINVFVSTGATLTHDFIEALGFSHYQGSSEIDDKILHEKNLDRIYDVLMKNDVYQEMESWFIEHFDEVNSESNSEFLEKIGKILNQSESSRNSILAACFRKKVPVFAPPLSNCGIGLMVWGMMLRKKKPLMNEYNDLNKMLDIAWTAKKKAVFYVTGGEPKNYIQQAMQFSAPAIYGVQIKIDPASYGGSSGAPLREGISWGKMSEEGRFIDINSDPTIILPLILSFLKDNL
jgi:deoxyhypusine synthase